MKKRAIIYTRVSTDEQADKGYSLGYQEERLKKYCDINNIAVVAHYQDDHSAKTFERPEFIRLLTFCKKNPGDVDLLLFINWSRFSRNAGDSYGMIKQLNKLGVEPHAIEQPLDLTIPENKMMLAFYLAAPEVENDRRAANVIMGIYRARKEGRYTSKAPIGYKNIRDLLGKATIAPDAQAPLIIEAFEEYAKGIYHVEEVRDLMKQRGLKVGHSMFSILLKHQIYIGRVFVPAYKDEPAHFVKGLHEPLISETLFNKVQQLLNVRSGALNRPTKNLSKEELPLRTFMKCETCGGNMTGSASRGRNGRYFYYHCRDGSHKRFKADQVNEEFVNHLKTFKIDSAVNDLYYEVLTDHLKKSRVDGAKEVKRVTEEIVKNKSRIQNAQKLMLDGDISSEEYKEIRNKFELANDELIRRKANVSSGEDNYEGYLRYSYTLLKDLAGNYEKASLEVKQLIVGSIFPEKLIFSESKVRTTRVNQVVSLICLNSSDLEGKKKAEGQQFSDASALVPKAGIEPAHLTVHDFESCASTNSAT